MSRSATSRASCGWCCSIAATVRVQHRLGTHAASFHEAAEQVAKHFPKKIEIVELPRSGPVNIIHRHFAVGALLRVAPGFPARCRWRTGIAAAHKEVANG